MKIKERRGENTLRFARFCYDNLITKVVLAFITVVSWSGIL